MNAENQIHSCWVRSVNDTSVSCRPPLELVVNSVGHLSQYHSGQLAFLERPYIQPKVISQASSTKSQFKFRRLKMFKWRRACLCSCSHVCALVCVWVTMGVFTQSNYQGCKAFRTVQMFNFQHQTLLICSPRGWCKILDNIDSSDVVLRCLFRSAMEQSLKYWPQLNSQQYAVMINKATLPQGTNVEFQLLHSLKKPQRFNSNCVSNCGSHDSTPQATRNNVQIRSNSPEGKRIIRCWLIKFSGKIQNWLGMKRKKKEFRHFRFFRFFFFSSFLSFLLL